MSGASRPGWMDSLTDTEVQFDQLFSWVALEMPQYTINDLRRMKIHKFVRLVYEAEDRQKARLKAARS